MDEQGAPKGCKRHRTLIRFFQQRIPLYATHKMATRLLVLVCGLTASVRGVH